MFKMFKMFVEGTITPFAILLAIIITMISTVWMSKKGFNFELRHLPAVEALEEAVGRAVELGGPVHWCMGTGRGRPLSSGIAVTVAASFAILNRLARLCARFGATLLPSIGQPEGITIVDAICSEAYIAEGVPEQWDSNNIGFFPDKSYVIGVPARIAKEQVKANIMVGYFVKETIIIAEIGASVGAFQIGGTTAWNNIAYAATSCDYFLIGEEIFAAGVYLSEDLQERATLIGNDITKILFIIITVIGNITLSFGSNLISELLKM